MPLIDTVSEDSFIFEHMIGFKDEFTVEARRAIFKWYDQFEENIEIYPFDIAFTWDEYDSVESVLEDYEGEYKTFEALENDTTVLHLTNGHIIVMNPDY